MWPLNGVVGVTLTDFRSVLNTHPAPLSTLNPRRRFVEFIIVTLWPNEWVTLQRCLTSTRPDVWSVSYPPGFFQERGRKDSLFSCTPRWSSRRQTASLKETTTDGENTRRTFIQWQTWESPDWNTISVPFHQRFKMEAEVSVDQRHLSFIPSPPFSMIEL